MISTSCEATAIAALARIAEREPVVHAWAHIEPAAVLAQARSFDARAERGPLHGVLLGVKDVIDVFDMPTQMGSEIYAGYRPFADASCVALARAAGAIIVGKTVTAEFAGTAPGPTTNPLDPSCTPGGSSSGSAAAIAAGMIPVALGTQTGGSVHRPASYCGVLGFKPTQCFIERSGVKPAAEFFDTVGILANSLDLLERVFLVLSNRPSAARPAVPGPIGLCRTPMWDAAEPATREALELTATALRSAGLEVVEVELPDVFSALGAARAVVNNYQRSHAMRFEWEHHRELLSPQMRDVITRGLALTAEQVEDAFRRIARCRDLASPIFERTGTLLTPCVDGEAPRGLTSTGEHRFQSLWTTLDLPTLSVPVRRGPRHLPVSVQFVAGRLHDHQLLADARNLMGFLPRLPL
jgi:Asp-tRNA(Asn)/Glu-tRNA(Gln) amidotransferase A subunit family amidase